MKALTTAFLLTVLSLPGLADAASDLQAIQDMVGQLRGAADRPALVAQITEACEAFLTDHPGADGTMDVRRYLVQLGPENGVAEEMYARVEAWIAGTDSLRDQIELYAILGIAARNKSNAMKELLYAPGTPLPDLTLPEIHGEDQIALSDLRGKIVLLDYWATWCGPCLRLMDAELKDLWETYKDKDFVLLGVGTTFRGDTAEAQLELSQSKGYTWPKVYDADSELVDTFMVSSIPFCVLVDTEGQVVVAGNGFQIMDQIKSYLEENLSSPE